MILHEAPCIEGAVVFLEAFPKKRAKLDSVVIVFKENLLADASSCDMVDVGFAVGSGRGSQSMSSPQIEPLDASRRQFCICFCSG